MLYNNIATLACFGNGGLYCSVQHYSIIRTVKKRKDILKQIKDGDNLLKEKFIEDYKPFIIKTVSRVTGKYVQIENSEEYSIGLIAFNEAIETFDEHKNPSFLNFCKQVIKRRIIDYIRKNKKTVKYILLHILKTTIETVCRKQY